MNLEPIFLHSLFRSGSTYVHNAFRRSGLGYWCYQEPFNEHVRHIVDAPELLLAIHAESEQLRHPRTETPYFWEYHQVRGAIAEPLRKEMSYDWYFADEAHPSFPAVVAYLRGLIAAAKGRPVFKCCRTTGRAAALARALGGIHVHLWRNPWDQWWSYKNGDYFDATTLLIFNAVPLPGVLAEVKQACGIADFHEAEIGAEVSHALDHRLASVDSYLAFYSLWLYGFLATDSAANMSMNIDSLSMSEAYRREISSRLIDLGVPGLDFSDCRIAQARFEAHDRDFFEPIERRAHEFFLRHGWTDDDLEAVVESRVRHIPRAESAPADLVADASRMRQLAVRYGSAVAEAQHRLSERDTELTEARRAGEAARSELAAAVDRETRGEVELADARGRIGELEGELGGLRASLADARERIAELEGELGGLRASLADARQHAKQVEGELAAAYARADGLASDLDELRSRSDSLRANLAAARQAAVQAGVELARTHERLAAIRAEAVAGHERSQWLENEWNAAKAKIGDLERQSRHWWTVADGLNHELQAMRATRSWRITAPLRSANALRREFVRKIARREASGVETAGTGRRLLNSLLRKLLSHPGRKAGIARLLARYPRLDARLREFARAASTGVGSGSTQSADRMIERAGAADATSSRLDRHPRSVRQAYAQLVRARSEARAQDPRSDATTPQT